MRRLTCHGQVFDSVTSQGIPHVELCEGSHARPEMSATTTAALLDATANVIKKVFIKTGLHNNKDEVVVIRLALLSPGSGTRGAVYPKMEEGRRKLARLESYTRCLTAGT